MKRTRPMGACVDCGTTVRLASYRCTTCAATERGHFLRITGRAVTPKKTAAGRAWMAATNQRRAEELAERVELVEDYLASGIEPERIAADFGINVHSLERSMARAGRDDLASRVHVARHRDSRSLNKRCPECGDQITDRAKTCTPCHRAMREFANVNPNWRAA